MNLFDPTSTSTASLQRVRFHYASDFHAISHELNVVGCAEALQLCATTSLTWALKKQLKSDRVFAMPSLLKQLTHDALPEGRFANELKLSSALYDHLKGDHSEVGRALLRGRQALLKSIIKLEMDHLTPKDLHFTPKEDPTGLMARGAEAWRHLRSVASEHLTPLRESVWRASPETMLSALKRLSPEAHPLKLTGLTVALHGFYFITPPQWALVRQLTLAGVECVFFVHDDGHSVVYDTWRRFFPARPADTSADPSAVISALTRPAQALHQALKGSALTAQLSADDLKVICYPTGAELFKSKEVMSLLPSGAHLMNAPIDSPQSDIQIAQGRDKREPALYAADFKGASRLLKIMSDDEACAQLNLGNTPAGQLLLALHNAVRVEEGEQGQVVSFELTHELVQDILASGYLSVDALSVYRRVRLFFEGCVSVDTWRARAQELVKLSNELPSLKAQTPITGATNQVWHPLDQLPWGGLSSAEATRLHEALTEAHQLLSDLFDHGVQQGHQVELRRQLRVMRELLEGKLSHLSEEEREVIQAQLNALYDPQRAAQSAPLTVNLVSFIDAIRALLSVEGSREEDLEEDSEEAESFSLSMLRGLDRFLVSARQGPLHLITLSDMSFPNTKSRGGRSWPFHQEHLFSGEALEITSSPEARLSKYLTVARQEGAVDAALYLFHLALNSKGGRSQAPQEITLSWVEDWGGERLGPSPFVRLLTREEVRGEALKVGGVSVSTPSLSQGLAPCDVSLKVGEAPNTSLFFSRLKYGSFSYCPRRFALQWLTGRGAYFVERYRMNMLIGNLKGYFMNTARRTGEALSESEALQINARLTPFLHEKERESAYQKASFQPYEFKKLPHPTWLLMIEGKKEDAQKPNPSPIAVAYNTASSGGKNADVPPQEAALTPPPHEERKQEKLCKKCPLQDLCVFGHEPQESDFDLEGLSL